jgi:molybdate transport system ATP-binding protein
MTETPPRLEVRISHRLSPDFLLDVAFDAPGRGVTALFGPSGAGKSSVIAALAGLLAAEHAWIAVGGTVLTDTGRSLHIAPARRRIGHVFQDARLFPHMSVRANLLYGWRRQARDAEPGEIDRIVAMLGLGELLPRRPATLSGGERQRVALGRALLAAPRLLLLDEPLAGLDAARKAEIMPWLETLRDAAQVPIVLVTHAIDEVARLADHVVALEAGRVVAEGPVFDMLARLDLPGLGRDRAAGAVFAARVRRVDDGEGLTELAFAGGTLLVPGLDKPAGAAVRVRIAAEDVMLALERPERISANNVVAGRITDIRARGPALADIRLDCGGTHLLARITARSVARLGLTPGTELYAVIKSVTVDRGG